MHFEKMNSLKEILLKHPIIKKTRETSCLASRNMKILYRKVSQKCGRGKKFLCKLIENKNIKNEKISTRFSKVWE